MPGFCSKQPLQKALNTAFKTFINQHFDMPDKMLNLLLRFLDQYEGKLSKRAREKEFQALSEQEVQLIESTYKEVFTS